MNSSRFSVITNNEENYADDMVIQKVIYYIALFHKEVYNIIKGIEEGQEEEPDELEAALDLAAA